MMNHPATQSAIPKGELKLNPVLEQRIQEQATEMQRLRNQIGRIENFADRLIGSTPKLDPPPNGQEAPISALARIDYSIKELREATDRVLEVARRLEEVA